jgi:HSP20 family protein
MGRNFWVGQQEFGPSNWTAGAITPHVDVDEDEEGVQIFVELAGVSEQDIQLALDSGVLTVFGEKHPHNKQEWQRNRYLAERSFGTFRRSINLPYGLNEDAAEAEFDNGVLSVRIPWYKEIDTPRGKKISIKPR